jgi:hypothetical protein
LTSCTIWRRFLVERLVGGCEDNNNAAKGTVFLTVVFVTKLMPTLADRGCRVVSATNPDDGGH